jgi:hypothetical protein
MTKHLLSRIVITVGIGCAITAAATVAQPYFVAGHISDFVCHFILLPGQSLASLFHDGGPASPEFLWRSRVFNSMALGGVIFLILGPERNF